MCIIDKLIRETLKNKPTHKRPHKRQMNKLNNPLVKCAVMTALIITHSVYVVTLSEYQKLGAFWVILAVLHISFWGVAFYPNYNWAKLNLFRKILGVWVLITFCLYFLPTDILLSDPVSKFHLALSYVGLITSLLSLNNNDDDDDNDGGHHKKVEAKKPKHKWAFLTNQV